MEQILHYIWQYKLYSQTDLKTTDGRKIDVIDAGIYNTDAGPDFFNAKIKIDGRLWAGMVEIHNKASDWKLHGHQSNKAYDGVVLHVVCEENMRIRRSNGEFIPQMIMSVSNEIKERIAILSENNNKIICGQHIRNIPQLHITSWMGALLAERIQRKTNEIKEMLKNYSNNWNEVFYVSLCRSFGFGINNDALERMARSLPFIYLQKHRNSQMQIEAMMFGQAGALEEVKPDQYHTLLRKEYLFLRNKFNLSPIPESSFKHLRLRPANFPFIRIAQLAAIITKYPTMFSTIMEAQSIKEIENLIMVEPSDYWSNHYHFENSSPKKEKKLTASSADIIIINTIVPMIMAYGDWKGEPAYCEKALYLLEHIAAERNSIVTTFAFLGIKAENAAQSQALIQLKREYCEKKKCLYCRIGYQLLKENKRYPLRHD